jgi:peptidoglycan/xylan/chitin deacetylase (PgdA/CDA1 family)
MSKAMRSLIVEQLLPLCLGIAASSCLVPPRPQGATGSVPAAPAVADDDLPLAPDGGLPERTFPWPGTARGAVSLTYDDGLASHVEVVGPALKKHHLHGTFFITGNASPVHDAFDKWSALYRDGNEIGSHTMNHPCDAAQSWVKKGYGLQDYDLARMEKELTDNIEQLKAMGKKNGPYTFAYPCGMTWVGERQDSYKELVQRYFFAARGTASAVANPDGESFADLPAVGADKDPDQLVEFTRQVERDGGWLIIMFHGVGSEHLSVTVDQHERLLRYLEKHRDTVWTDTFLNVAQFVAAHRPVAKKGP